MTKTRDLANLVSGSNPLVDGVIDYSEITNTPAPFDPDTLAAVAVSGSYADLGGKPALATVATSGSFTDLSNQPAPFDPATLAAVATTGAYGSLSGTPALAAVATTGAYGNLTGTPTLAAVATTGAYSSLSGVPALAAVATSGSYSSLSGTPAAALPLTGGTLSGALIVSGELTASSLSASTLNTVFANRPVLITTEPNFYVGSSFSYTISPYIAGLTYAISASNGATVSRSNNILNVTLNNLGTTYINVNSTTTIIVAVPLPFVPLAGPGSFTTEGATLLTASNDMTLRLICVGGGGQTGGAGVGGAGGTSLSWVRITSGSVIQVVVGNKTNGEMAGGNTRSGIRGGAGSYVKLISGSSSSLSGVGSYLCVGGGGGTDGEHKDTTKKGGNGNGGSGISYSAGYNTVNGHAESGGAGQAGVSNGAYGASSTTSNKLTGGNGGSNAGNFGGAGGGGYGGGSGAASGQSQQDGQSGGVMSDWNSGHPILKYARGGGGGGSHATSCGGTGGGGGGFATSYLTNTGQILRSTQAGTTEAVQNPVAVLGYPTGSNGQSNIVGFVRVDSYE